MMSFKLSMNSFLWSYTVATVVSSTVGSFTFGLMVDCSMLSMARLGVKLYYVFSGSANICKPNAEDMVAQNNIH